ERLTRPALVVVREERRPADADLALCSGARSHTALGIADPHLPPPHRRAVARRTPGERRIPGPCGAERRGLGHAERPDSMMIRRVETGGPLGVRADALAQPEPRLGEARMRDQRLGLVRPGKEDRT